MESRPVSESKVGRTVSGEFWRDFCRARGDRRNDSPSRDLPDPLDRAEGFRDLTRVLRMTLEMQVEASEPLTPRFQLGCRPDIKLGCDNPDSYDLTSTLDSRHEYRVHGRLGTIPYFSIGGAEALGEAYSRFGIEMTSSFEAFLEQEREKAKVFVSGHDYDPENQGPARERLFEELGELYPRFG